MKSSHSVMLKSCSLRIILKAIVFSLLFLSSFANSRADTLYVGNGDNTILQFGPGGVGSVFASTGVLSPQGLAFDRAGNLYVANQSYNNIARFTPAGVGSVFANSGLSAPFGLAFDSSGNLYAANNNNRS